MAEQTPFLERYCSKHTQSIKCVYSADVSIHLQYFDDSSHICELHKTCPLSVRPIRSRMPSVKQLHGSTKYFDKTQEIHNPPAPWSFLFLCMCMIQFISTQEVCSFDQLKPAAFDHICSHFLM